MAIVAVARDLADLRARLGAITVGATFDGEPVTAEQIGAAGSMAVLLKEALKPNLVQTLEGQPALVHCGPFANIAHGNNSLVADLLGLKLADYVVTESGFGADMGFEKFVDIVCRLGGIAPSVVVLVATVQALKHHGGDVDGGLAGARARVRQPAREPPHRPQASASPCVDRDQPLPRRLRGRDRGRPAASRASSASAASRSTTGSSAAARARSSSPRPSSRRLRPGRAGRSFLYALDDPIEQKIEAIATQAYGAAGVELSPAARAQAERLRAARASAGLPICMAKTHLSLSHDPALIDAPTGFTLPGARAAALHRRRLDRRGVRRHADDARPARELGGEADRHRRRRRDGRPALALFARVRHAERRRGAEAPARVARRDDHEHDDRRDVGERVRPEHGRPEADLAGLELGRERLERAEEVRADEAQLGAPEREDHERDRDPAGAAGDPVVHCGRDRERERRAGDAGERAAGERVRVAVARRR